MKERMSTIILAALLLVLSAVSLFVGVIDVTPIELFRGNMEQLEIFLISRLPRLLAITFSEQVSIALRNLSFFQL